MTSFYMILSLIRNSPDFKERLGKKISDGLNETVLNLITDPITSSLCEHKNLLNIQTHDVYQEALRNSFKTDTQT